MMKLKACSLLIVFIFFAWPATAQYRISGTVTDQKTGSPIADTQIYDNEAGKSFLTNKEGEFQITGLPEGTYNLFFYALGYEIATRSFTIEDSSITTDIVMEPLNRQMTEVAVIAQRDKLFSMQRLRQVEGTSIFAGKKNEVISLSQMTVNTSSNNARQIYSQVSGLNIFDSNDAGLQLNIGGRGLDPNRSSNFNIRQNGYDISADVLGYPESYYTPPAEALSEIQVIRGAASLQYGTQFGGLVNFKMKKPNRNKPFELTTRNSAGSNSLFTTHNSVSGTTGDLGYYAYYNHKEGDSFRPNSGFKSDNVYLYTDYNFGDKTTLSTDFTYLYYLAQQPGGLTDAQFNSDPTFSNRTRNWFEVDWKLASAKIEHRFSYQTRFSVLAYGLDASRKSVGFRTNRVSQQDDLDAPRDLIVGHFNNWGTEARFLHRYSIAGKNNVLLLGSKFYKSDNTSMQGPGSAGSGPDFSFAGSTFPNYPNQSDFTFPNRNLAFFGEHIFYLNDHFSITPGFRYEYIKTESLGTFKRINFDLAGNPILNETFSDDRFLDRNFLLLGAGISYYTPSNLEIYGNFSQNYRSVTFNDIRIVNPTFQIDPDITDESGFTADIGLRGQYNEIFSYDVNVFGLMYDDRLGEVLRAETRVDASGETVETGRVVRFRGNIGRAFMFGLESIAELNVLSLLGTDSPDSRLNIFANTAITQSDYLDSEIPGVEGNSVEFVPLINLKTGVSFGFKNLLGSLQYTYVSRQFTDASNAEQNVNDNQSGIKGEIPAYGIMDLSLSWSYRFLAIEAGVNNVLDANYFTRRATGYPGPGIIPSPPRTVYSTLQIKI
jgi:Fe(3+) dicitrate transport protein